MDNIGRKEIKNFDLLMDRSEFSEMEESTIYDPQKLIPFCTKRCCFKGCCLSIFLILALSLTFYILVMNDALKDTLCFTEKGVLMCDISLIVGAIFPKSIGYELDNFSLN